MKKLLLLFTVIFTLCLVLTGCAEAEPDETTTTSEAQLEQMKLVLGDDGWIIESITDLSITSIDIPASHNGKAITTIKKQAFEDCSALESITIPSNIKYIGSYAFKNCTSLESIYITNKDTLIEKTAFDGCDITVAQLSSSHIDILPAADLEEIYLLDGTIEQAAFRGFYSLRVIGVAGDVTFSEFALEACNATTFKLPPDKIKDFSHKSRVFSLIISPSLTNTAAIIPANAFEGYSILSNITFEHQENGYTISDSAFDGCIATSFTVDASFIKSLPLSTETLTITSGSIEYYGSTRNLNLKTLIIESGVTAVAQSAFRECTSLKSVSVMAKIDRISEYTFYKCTALESISFGAGINTISSNAFSGCTSIKKLTLGSELKTICENAFKGCSKLSELNIRSGITTIEKSAFDGCTSLSTLNIGSGLSSLDLTAFLNCGTLTSITVDSSNTALKLVSGALLTADGKTLIKFCQGETEYTIPSGVEVIYEQAFKGNTTLKSLVIPNTVKEIGKNAFEECISLESVTLSTSLTEIGESVFRECEALKSIEIPAGITKIGKNAFYGCKALESVTLFVGLTEIGQTAFYNCDALGSIIIPSTITAIGERAFASCDSLTLIELSDVNPSKNLGEGWSSGTDAEIVYTMKKE